jgi:signal transduction histidine kinase
MKELIKRGIAFVKNNPTIIYSLALIFVVNGALFLNSYVILNRFGANLDKTLRTKAVLAEDIFSVVANDYFADVSKNEAILKESISRIQGSDPEIVEMNIYNTNISDGIYVPVVSSKSTLNVNVNSNEANNDKITQNAIKFAISIDDAFAYLSNRNGERYWNVVKAVRKDSVVVGVISLKLSIAENDALVRKTILQVYALTLGAMVIVLLLIFNHIRLFSFEIRAKKLEEIDKMKDDFISMASHELKSPLTAIRGYTELLEDAIHQDSLGSEKGLMQKKYISNITVSVNRLKTLVDDLLDVSRIEQNRLPMDLKELDLAEIVLCISDEMSVLAKEKGLVLKHDIAEVSTVLADSERLKQIVVNLISNAIKYTFRGEVTVQIKEKNDVVLLIVADSGLGISAENMKNLFSKFYRVKNADTEGISGTGLGLWIAREIAQKMGGDLNVESIEGVGSHFTLTLKKINKSR